MALCLDGSIESKNISLISNSAGHPLDCGYTGIFCREDRYSELGQVPAIVLSTAIDRFLPIATGSLGSVKSHLILELDARLSRDRSWPFSAGHGYNAHWLNPMQSMAKCSAIPHLTTKPLLPTQKNPSCASTQEGFFVCS